MHGKAYLSFVKDTYSYPHQILTTLDVFPISINFYFYLQQLAGYNKFSQVNFCGHRIYFELHRENARNFEKYSEKIGKSLIKYFCMKN